MMNRRRAIIKDTLNYRKTLFMIICILAFFVGVTIFTLLYMAKDNDYNNTIYQYFNISKRMHVNLMYTNISKDSIINGMNICSTLFIGTNYILALYYHNPSKIMRNLRWSTPAFAVLALELLVFNTEFYRKFYIGEFGVIPDTILFRNTYDDIHTFTIVFNFICLFTGLANIIFAGYNRTSIKALRLMKYYAAAIYLAICSLYFYMFFYLPTPLLWISRSTNYIGYLSLKMLPYHAVTSIIPYLVFILVVLMIAALSKYEKTIKKVQNDEYVFSNIVTSADISSRTFSHYIKNELVGIMAELDYLQKDMPEKKENIDVIRKTCSNMYNRLDVLQKHSNQVVLNQTQQNVNSLIENVLQYFEKIFAEQNVQLYYKKSNDPATILVI